MSDWILQANGLTKIYKQKKLKTEVLRGVDLTVSKGEVVSIMGPSGCGKTTLLNLLGGLDKPSRGEVFLNGYEITGMKDSVLSRFRLENIGFVFQFLNLIPTLTALENVELPLAIARKPAKERAERALFLLGQVGLHQKAGSFPHELSGGEQQRVAIARALVNDPKVVLMDEPTGNLDSKNSMLLMDLISRVNEDDQQTFVIVTHDQHIAEMTGRTIQMKDGLIIGDNKQGSKDLKCERSTVNTYLDRLDRLYLSKKISRQQYDCIRSRHIKKLVEIETSQQIHLCPC